MWVVFVWLFMEMTFFRPNLHQTELDILSCVLCSLTTSHSDSSNSYIFKKYYRFHFIVRTLTLEYIIRRHFVLWCDVCPLESQADAQGRVLRAIYAVMSRPLVVWLSHFTKCHQLLNPRISTQVWHKRDTSVSVCLSLWGHLFHHLFHYLHWNIPKFNNHK